MGLLDLALRLICSSRSADKVDYCGSTLGCGWVIFWSCSTILVYVSVFTSLVLCDFSLEYRCQFSNCIKVSVPKRENGAAGADFSVC